LITTSGASSAYNPDISSAQATAAITALNTFIEILFT
jgi:hypothetical protein